MLAPEVVLVAGLVPRVPRGLWILGFRMLWGWAWEFRCTSNPQRNLLGNAFMRGRAQRNDLSSLRCRIRASGRTPGSGSWPHPGTQYVT